MKEIWEWKMGSALFELVEEFEINVIEAILRK